MMSEPTTQYGVSYIASAPEELKVGDNVVIAHVDCVNVRHEGKKGTITLINPNNTFKVGFGGYSDDYPREYLIKLPDPITFEEESDNVKAFYAILCEMGETYKAKNETYGDAYQEGFNRFGAVQLVSRMYEKYCRIENLLVHNADNKVPDESVADTLTDLAVQAMCLRMLLQKSARHLCAACFCTG